MGWDGRGRRRGLREGVCEWSGNASFLSFVLSFFHDPKVVLLLVQIITIWSRFQHLIQLNNNKQETSARRT